jgi:hypothetical protein
VVAVRPQLAGLEQAQLPGAAATELRHLFLVRQLPIPVAAAADVCLLGLLETEAPEAVAMVATERQGLLEQPTRVAAVAAVVLKQAEPVTAAQAVPASS